jgi:hypothetical protein
VRSGSGADAEVALAPLVIGDPSYFPAGMTSRTGRVIRTICILDHPVKGMESPESAQIILPQSQVGRKNGECVGGGPALTRIISTHARLLSPSSHQTSTSASWATRTK